jgi:hypothetical protein
MLYILIVPVLDFCQDVVATVKTHLDGHRIIAEYEISNTIAQHKDLFVRMLVSQLIDQNGGRLYEYSFTLQTCDMNSFMVTVV